jgi:NADH:ubiquinone oxidoreductase subunit 5 (subunit L)/multisubunit Na+/H+ antiporter MnhA subunit
VVARLWTRLQPARLDGLGLLFRLLNCGIGLLVVLYASWYLPQSDRLGCFYEILLLFMAAMLGVVLSENLLLVFWELTSLSSLLLVAYDSKKYASRSGARLALAVTGGGLALLAGILLLGHLASSHELSVILDAGERIRAHALYAPALILVLLGAFTKSAQFPCHFWLPSAMAAPTPVSAYLHSATMVKAGVFLLARLYPALGGSDLCSGWSERRARSRWSTPPQWRSFVMTSRGCWRFDDQPAWPDHAAVRSRHAALGGGRNLSHHQPRDLQGFAVHGRRHH